MARNAPCAEAARQRVSTECVHRHSTFASMSNTDSESDAESDVDPESVDESADSVVWIRMEVAFSRPDHLPTLSAAKTSKLSRLVKHHILAIDEAS